MAATFRDYLDAKFALDERSLNPAVRSAFLSSLRDRPALALLDLGTGSGASIWRLLNANLAADLEITAVDLDTDLLDLAFKRMVVLLGARGFKVWTSPGSLRGERGKRRVAIDFVRAELPDFGHEGPGRYDAVMAQALMDLLPAPLMTKRIAGWLRSRGVFYASLNYDGGTTLFPMYPDSGLEDRILGLYDASMERQLAGQPCGGARSGRRLHAALRETGFEVLAYGSSDWSLTPLHGRYRDRDDVCLSALLEMIRGEAEKSGRIDADALDTWYRRRVKQIEAGELGLLSHQIDILAEKASSRV
jgi:SAM-dependent methyltransferase